MYEAFYKSHFPGFAESSAFALFDLASHLTTDDRKELVLSISTRHGFDGKRACRQMFGPSGISSKGLLARARWHYGPAGRLVEAQQHRVEKTHPPDSQISAAWLRTYKEVRRNPIARKEPAVRILEIDLSKLSGSGTVERWLGEIQLSESKRRAHKLNKARLDGGIRILVQDEKGRRRTRSDTNKCVCQRC